MQHVADGTFREDLLYRLREFALTIPPLREWPQLPAFLQQLWQTLGAEARHVQLSPALLTHLATLPWPGNVRQLQSLLKVLLALADEGEQLEVEDLPGGVPVSPGSGSVTRIAAARCPLLPTRCRRITVMSVKRRRLWESRAARSTGAPRGQETKP